MINAQTGKLKSWIRTIAFFTVFIFTFTSVVWDGGINKAYAAAAQPRLDSRVSTTVLTSIIDRSDLPETYGTIKNSYRGAGDQVFIHVQDAHINEEAQLNIANILKWFSEKHQMRLVNIEGAEGELNAKTLTAISDKAARKDVSGYFLREGRMAGADYFAIVDKPELTLYGAEDNELYEENRKAYVNALEFKDKDEKVLSSLRSIMEKVGRFIFSDEARELYRRRVDFQDGGAQLVAYVRYLVSIAEKNQMDLSAYSGMKSLLQLVDLEKKVNFDKAESEVDRLVEHLKKTLQSDKLSRFLTNTVHFRMKRMNRADYYSYLQSEIDGLIDAETVKTQYLNAIAYIEYMKLYDLIGIAIFDEIEFLERTIKAKILTTPEAQKLDQLYRVWDIMQKMFDFSLTKQDAEYFYSNQTAFSSNNFVEFLTPLMKEHRFSDSIPANASILDTDLSKVEKFYQLALERDIVIIERAIEKTMRSGQKVSAIVTGGFHTPGIEAALKEKGFSYLVVTPRISKSIDQKKESKLYDEALRQTPLPIEKVLSETLTLQSGTVNDPRFQLSAKHFLDVPEMVDQAATLMAAKSILNAVAEGKSPAARLEELRRTAADANSPKLMKILNSFEVGTINGKQVPVYPNINGTYLAFFSETTKPSEVSPKYRSSIQNLKLSDDSFLSMRVVAPEQISGISRSETRQLTDGTSALKLDAFEAEGIKVEAGKIERGVFQKELIAKSGYAGYGFVVPDLTRASDKALRDISAAFSDSKINDKLKAVSSAFSEAGVDPIAVSSQAVLRLLSENTADEIAQKVSLLRLLNRSITTSNVGYSVEKLQELAAEAQAQKQAAQETAVAELAKTKVEVPTVAGGVSAEMIEQRINAFLGKYKTRNVNGKEIENSEKVLNIMRLALRGIFADPKNSENNAAANSVFTRFEEQIKVARDITEESLNQVTMGAGKTTILQLGLQYLYDKGFKQSEGKGVVLVTANDKLSERDAEKSAAMFGGQGIIVGSVSKDESGKPIGHIYDLKTKTFKTTTAEDVYKNTDFIFGSMETFQFRAIEERKALNEKDRIFTSREFAHLLDEADAQLDNNNPAIISGGIKEDAEEIRARTIKANAFVKGIFFSGVNDGFVDVSEAKNQSRSVKLTEKGVAKLRASFPNLSESEFDLLKESVNTSLTVYFAYEEGVDYVVKTTTAATEDGKASKKVEIVLLSEGQERPGTRLQGGLHSAIEAKHMQSESDVQLEHDIEGSITVPEYLSLPHVKGWGGVSGTYDKPQMEAKYGKVVKESALKSKRGEEGAIFATEQEKTDAFLADALARHRAGHPIIIKVAEGKTAETAKQIRDYFAKNGEKVDEEAVGIFDATSRTDLKEFEATAGKKGAISVVTQIGARGVDVKVENGKTIEEMLDEAIDKVQAEITRQNLVFTGYALYIDDKEALDIQFRGRVGRANDEGLFRAFWSADDPIFNKYKELAGVQAVLADIKNALRSGKTLTSEQAFKLISTLQTAVSDQEISSWKSNKLFGEEKNARLKEFTAIREAILKGEFNSPIVQNIFPGLSEFAASLNDANKEKLRIGLLKLMDKAWSKYETKSEESRVALTRILQSGWQGVAAQKDAVESFQKVMRGVYQGIVLELQKQIAGISAESRSEAEEVIRRIDFAARWKSFGNKLLAYVYGGAVVGAVAVVIAKVMAFVSVTGKIGGGAAALASLTDTLAPVMNLLPGWAWIGIALFAAMGTFAIAQTLLKRFQQSYRGTKNIALLLSGQAVSEERASAGLSVLVQPLTMIVSITPIGVVLTGVAAIAAPALAPLLWTIAAISAVAALVAAGLIVAVNYSKHIKDAARPTDTAMGRIGRASFVGLALMTGLVTVFKPIILTGAAASFTTIFGAVAILAVIAFSGYWVMKGFDSAYGKEFAGLQHNIKLNQIGAAVGVSLAIFAGAIAFAVGSTAIALTVLMSLGSILFAAVSILQIIAAPGITKKIAEQKSAAKGERFGKRDAFGELFEFVVVNARSIILGLGGIVGLVFTATNLALPITLAYTGLAGAAATVVTAAGVTLILAVVISLVFMGIAKYRNGLLERKAKGEIFTNKIEKVFSTDSKKIVGVVLGLVGISAAMPSLAAGAQYVQQSATAEYTSVTTTSESASVTEQYLETGKTSLPQGITVSVAEKTVAQKPVTASQLEDTEKKAETPVVAAPAHDVSKDVVAPPPPREDFTITMDKTSFGPAGIAWKVSRDGTTAADNEENLIEAVRNAEKDASIASAQADLNAFIYRVVQAFDTGAQGKSEEDQKRITNAKAEFLEEATNGLAQVSENPLDLNDVVANLDALSHRLFDLAGLDRDDARIRQSIAEDQAQTRAELMEDALRLSESQAEKDAAVAVEEPVVMTEALAAAWEDYEKFKADTIENLINTEDAERLNAFNDRADELEKNVVTVEDLHLAQLELDQIATIFEDAGGDVIGEAASGAGDGAGTPPPPPTSEYGPVVPLLADMLPVTVPRPAAEGSAAGTAGAAAGAARVVADKLVQVDAKRVAKDVSVSGPVAFSKEIIRRTIAGDQLHEPMGLSVATILFAEDHQAPHVIAMAQEAENYKDYSEDYKSWGTFLTAGVRSVLTKHEETKTYKTQTIEKGERLVDIDDEYDFGLGLTELETYSYMKTNVSSVTSKVEEPFVASASAGIKTGSAEIKEDKLKKLQVEQTRLSAKHAYIEQQMDKLFHMVEIVTANRSLETIQENEKLLRELKRKQEKLSGISAEVKARSKSLDVALDGLEVAKNDIAKERDRHAAHIAYLSGRADISNSEDFMKFVNGLTFKKIEEDISGSHLPTDMARVVVQSARNYVLMRVAEQDKIAGLSWQLTTPEIGVSYGSEYGWNLRANLFTFDAQWSYRDFQKNKAKIFKSEAAAADVLSRLLDEVEKAQLDRSRIDDVRKSIEELKAQKDAQQAIVESLFSDPTGKSIRDEDSNAALVKLLKIQRLLIAAEGDAYQRNVAAQELDTVIRNVSQAINELSVKFPKVAKQLDVKAKLERLQEAARQTAKERNLELAQTADALYRKYKDLDNRVHIDAFVDGLLAGNTRIAAGQFASIARRADYVRSEYFRVFGYANAGVSVSLSDTGVKTKTTNIGLGFDIPILDWTRSSEAISKEAAQRASVLTKTDVDMRLHFQTNELLRRIANLTEERQRVEEKIANEESKSKKIEEGIEIRAKEVTDGSDLSQQSKLARQAARLSLLEAQRELAALDENRNAAVMMLRHLTDTHLDSDNVAVLSKEAELKLDDSNYVESLGKFQNPAFGFLSLDGKITQEAVPTIKKMLSVTHSLMSEMTKKLNGLKRANPNYEQKLKELEEERKSLDAEAEQLLKEKPQQKDFENKKDFNKAEKAWEAKRSSYAEKLAKNNKNKLPLSAIRDLEKTLSQFQSAERDLNELSLSPDGDQTDAVRGMLINILNASDSYVTSDYLLHKFFTLGAYDSRDAFYEEIRTLLGIIADKTAVRGIVGRIAANEEAFVKIEEAWNVLKSPLTISLGATFQATWGGNSGTSVSGSFGGVLSHLFYAPASYLGLTSDTRNQIAGELLREGARNVLKTAEAHQKEDVAVRNVQKRIGVLSSRVKLYERLRDEFTKMQTEVARKNKTMGFANLVRKLFLNNRVSEENLNLKVLEYQIRIEKDQASIDALKDELRDTLNNTSEVEGSAGFQEGAAEFAVTEQSIKNQLEELGAQSPEQRLATLDSIVSANTANLSIGGGARFSNAISSAGSSFNRDLGVFYQKLDADSGTPGASGNRYFAMNIDVLSFAGNRSETFALLMVHDESERGTLSREKQAQIQAQALELLRAVYHARVANNVYREISKSAIGIHALERVLNLSRAENAMKAMAASALGNVREIEALETVSSQIARLMAELGLADSDSALKNKEFLSRLNGLVAAAGDDITAESEKLTKLAAELGVNFDLIEGLDLSKTILEENKLTPATYRALLREEIARQFVKTLKNSRFQFTARGGFRQPTRVSDFSAAEPLVEFGVSAIIHDSNVAAAEKFHTKWIEIEKIKSVQAKLKDNKTWKDIARDIKYLSQEIEQRLKTVKDAEELYRIEGGIGRQFGYDDAPNDVVFVYMNELLAYKAAVDSYMSAVQRANSFLIEQGIKVDDTQTSPSSAKVKDMIPAWISDKISFFDTGVEEKYEAGNGLNVDLSTAKVSANTELIIDTRVDESENARVETLYPDISGATAELLKAMGLAPLDGNANSEEKADREDLQIIAQNILGRVAANYGKKDANAWVAEITETYNKLSENKFWDKSEFASQNHRTLGEEVFGNLFRAAFFETGRVNKLLRNANIDLDKLAFAAFLASLDGASATRLSPDERAAFRDAILRDLPAARKALQEDKKNKTGVFRWDAVQFSEILSLAIFHVSDTEAKKMSFEDILKNDEYRRDIFEISPEINFNNVSNAILGFNRGDDSRTTGWEELAAFLAIAQGKYDPNTKTVSRKILDVANPETMANVLAEVGIAKAKDDTTAYLIARMRHNLEKFTNLDPTKDELGETTYNRLVKLVEDEANDLLDKAGVSKDDIKRRRDTVEKMQIEALRFAKAAAYVNNILYGTGFEAGIDRNEWLAKSLDERVSLTEKNMEVSNGLISRGIKNHIGMDKSLTPREQKQAEAIVNGLISSMAFEIMGETGKDIGREGIKRIEELKKEAKELEKKIKEKTLSSSATTATSSVSTATEDGSVETSTLPTTSVTESSSDVDALMARLEQVREKISDFEKNRAKARADYETFRNLPSADRETRLIELQKEMNAIQPRVEKMLGRKLNLGEAADIAILRAQAEMILGDVQSKFMEGGAFGDDEEAWDEWRELTVEKRRQIFTKELDSAAKLKSELQGIGVSFNLSDRDEAGNKMPVEERGEDLGVLLSLAKSVLSDKLSNIGTVFTKDGEIVQGKEGLAWAILTATRDADVQKAADEFLNKTYPRYNTLTPVEKRGRIFSAIEETLADHATSKELSDLDREKSELADLIKSKLLGRVALYEKTGSATVFDRKSFDELKEATTVTDLTETTWKNLLYSISNLPKKSTDTVIAQVEHFGRVDLAKNLSFGDKLNQKPDFWLSDSERTRLIREFKTLSDRNKSSADVLAWATELLKMSLFNGKTVADVNRYAEEMEEVRNFLQAAYKLYSGADLPLGDLSAFANDVITAEMDVRQEQERNNARLGRKLTEAEKLSQQLEVFAVRYRYGHKLKLYGLAEAAYEGREVASNPYKNKNDRVSQIIYWLNYFGKINQGDKWQEVNADWVRQHHNGWSKQQIVGKIERILAEQYEGAPLFELTPESAVNQLYQDVQDEAIMDSVIYITQKHFLSNEKLSALVFAEREGKESIPHFKITNNVMTYAYDVVPFLHSLEDGAWNVSGGYANYLLLKYATQQIWDPDLRALEKPVQVNGKDLVVSVNGIDTPVNLSDLNNVWTSYLSVFRSVSILQEPINEMDSNKVLSSLWFVQQIKQLESDLKAKEAAGEEIAVAVNEFMTGVKRAESVFYQFSKDEDKKKDFINNWAKDFLVDRERRAGQKFERYDLVKIDAEIKHGRKENANKYAADALEKHSQEGIRNAAFIRPMVEIVKKEAKRGFEYEIGKEDAKIIAEKMVDEGWAARELLLLEKVIVPALTEGSSLTIEVRGDIYNVAEILLQKTESEELLKLRGSNPKATIENISLQTLKASIEKRIELYKKVIDLKKIITEQFVKFQVYSNDEKMFKNEIVRISTDAIERGFQTESLRRWFETAETLNMLNPKVDILQTLFVADGLLQLGLATQPREKIIEKHTDAEIAEKINETLGWIFAVSDNTQPMYSLGGKSRTDYENELTLEKYIKNYDSKTRQQIKEDLYARVTSMIKNGSLSFADLENLKKLTIERVAFLVKGDTERKSDTFSAYDLPQPHQVAPLTILSVLDNSAGEPSKRIGILNIIFSSHRGEVKGASWLRFNDFRDPSRLSEQVAGQTGAMVRREFVKLVDIYDPVDAGFQSWFGKNFQKISEASGFSKNSKGEESLAKIVRGALIVGTAFSLYGLLATLIRGRVFAAPKLSGYSKAENDKSKRGGAGTSGDAGASGAGGDGEGKKPVWKQDQSDKNIKLIKTGAILGVVRIYLFKFLQYSAVAGLLLLGLAVMPATVGTFSILFQIMYLLIHWQLFEQAMYAFLAYAFSWTRVFAVVGVLGSIFVGISFALGLPWLSAFGAILMANPITVSLILVWVGFFALVMFLGSSRMPSSGVHWASFDKYIKNAQDIERLFRPELNDERTKLAEEMKAQMDKVGKATDETDKTEAQNKLKELISKFKEITPSLDMNDFLGENERIDADQYVTDFAQSKPNLSVDELDGLMLAQILTLAYNNFKQKKSIIYFMDDLILQYVKAENSVSAEITGDERTQAVKEKLREIISAVVKGDKAFKNKSEEDQKKVIEARFKQITSWVERIKIWQKMADDVLTYENGAEKINGSDRLIVSFSGAGGMRKPVGNVLGINQFTGYGEDGTPGKYWGQISNGGELDPAMLAWQPSHDGKRLHVYGPMYITDVLLKAAKGQTLSGVEKSFIEEVKLAKGLTDEDLTKIVPVTTHDNEPFFTGVMKADGFVAYDSYVAHERPENDKTGLAVLLPKKSDSGEMIPRVIYSTTLDSGNFVNVGMDLLMYKAMIERPDAGMFQMNTGYVTDKSDVHYEEKIISHQSGFGTQISNGKIAGQIRAFGKYSIRTGFGREFGRPRPGVPMGSYFSRVMLYSGILPEIVETFSETETNMNMDDYRKAVYGKMNGGGGWVVIVNGEDEIVTNTASDMYVIAKAISDENVLKRLREKDNVLGRMYFGLKTPVIDDAAVELLEPDIWENLAKGGNPMPMGKPVLLMCKDRAGIIDDTDFNMIAEDGKAAKWGIINDEITDIFRNRGGFALTPQTRFFNDLPKISLTVEKKWMQSLLWWAAMGCVPGLGGITGVLGALLLTAIVLGTLMSAPFIGILQYYWAKTVNVVKEPGKAFKTYILEPIVDILGMFGEKFGNSGPEYVSSALKQIPVIIIELLQIISGSVLFNFIYNLGSLSSSKSKWRKFFDKVEPLKHGLIGLFIKTPVQKREMDFERERLVAPAPPAGIPEQKTKAYKDYLDNQTTRHGLALGYSFLILFLTQLGIAIPFWSIVLPVVYFTMILPGFYGSKIHSEFARTVISKDGYDVSKERFKPSEENVEHNYRYFAEKYRAYANHVIFSSLLVVLVGFFASDLALFLNPAFVFLSTILALYGFGRPFVSQWTGTIFKTRAVARTALAVEGTLIIVLFLSAIYIPLFNVIFQKIFGMALAKSAFLGGSGYFMEGMKGFFGLASAGFSHWWMAIQSASLLGTLSAIGLGVISSVARFLGFEYSEDAGRETWSKRLTGNWEKLFKAIKGPWSKKTRAQFWKNFKDNLIMYFKAFGATVGNSRARSFKKIDGKKIEKKTPPTPIAPAPSAGEPIAVPAEQTETPTSAETPAVPAEQTNTQAEPKRTTTMQPTPTPAPMEEKAEPAYAPAPATSEDAETTSTKLETPISLTPAPVAPEAPEETSSDEAVQSPDLMNPLTLPEASFGTDRRILTRLNNARYKVEATTGSNAEIYGAGGSFVGVRSKIIAGGNSTLTFSIGNPLSKPQYSVALELGYVYLRQELTLSVIFTDEGGETYSRDIKTTASAGERIYTFEPTLKNVASITIVNKTEGDSAYAIRFAGGIAGNARSELRETKSAREKELERALNSTRAMDLEIKYNEILSLAKADEIERSLTGWATNEKILVSLGLPSTFIRTNNIKIFDGFNTEKLEAYLSSASRDVRVIVANASLEDVEIANAIFAKFGIPKGYGVATSDSVETVMTKRALNVANAIQIRDTASLPAGVYAKLLAEIPGLVVVSDNNVGIASANQISAVEVIVAAFEAQQAVAIAA